MSTLDMPAGVFPTGIAAAAATAGAAKRIPETKAAPTKQLIGAAASLDEKSGEIEASRKVAAKPFGFPGGKLQLAVDDPKNLSIGG